jgi:hypothetical protein
MLVLIKNNFQLSPSTFMLSVSLYDRFLNTYDCDRLVSASTTPRMASTASNTWQLLLPWDTTPVSLDVDSPHDLRPSAAGMKQVCAPLACLIMANKYIDVFAVRLSDLTMAAKEIFRMNSESDADDNTGNSTSIGAFVLYERWLVHEMRTEDVR